MGNPRRQDANDEVANVMVTIEFHQCIDNAAIRCAEIARNERLKGKLKSAALYEEMAAEFSSLMRWLYHYMAERNTESLAEAGTLIRG